MEYSKAKIVGFITIMLILALLVFVALKIVDNNQKKQELEKQNITYKNQSIDVLVDDYVEYLKLGETYDETGVEALEKGEDISDNVIISYFKNDTQVAAIETDKTGNYLVKYTIIGENDEKTVYKTVIVVDDKNPVIKFPESTIITIGEVDFFDFTADVKVTDNSGDAKLTYDNTLKAKEGNYIITYKATDPSNNTAIKKRLIKVVSN